MELGCPTSFQNKGMFKAACNGYMGLYQGEEGVAAEKQHQIRIFGSDVHTGEVRGH